MKEPPLLLMIRRDPRTLKWSPASPPLIIHSIARGTRPKAHLIMARPYLWDRKPWERMGHTGADPTRGLACGRVLWGWVCCSCSLWCQGTATGTAGGAQTSSGLQHAFKHSSQVWGMASSSSSWASSSHRPQALARSWSHRCALRRAGPRCPCSCFFFQYCQQDCKHCEGSPTKWKRVDVWWPAGLKVILYWTLKGIYPNLTL